MYNPEFLQEIADLVLNPVVLKLNEWPHHMEFNRYDHSMNVAYRAWRICKRRGLDSRAAARGGMLHDLFFYDYAMSGLGFRHVYVHPVVALKNAREIVELSEVEAEIIELHMHPKCSRKPKYKETRVVARADKVCCMRELMQSSAHRVKRAIAVAW